MLWFSSFPENPADAADQRVFLHDVDWEQFEALLEMRGDCAGPRLAYADGVVELMSPSGFHETVKKSLARLVEMYADVSGVELNGYGSWTLKLKRRKRAIEPDECYVIGSGEHDRPDLAIEVVWTSGGLSKLDIYAALEVPEVWTWEGGRLFVHVFEDGEYVAVENSRLFPDLDLFDLLRYLDPERQTQSARAWRQRLQS